MEEEKEKSLLAIENSRNSLVHSNISVMDKIEERRHANLRAEVEAGERLHALP